MPDMLCTIWGFRGSILGCPCSIIRASRRHLHLLDALDPAVVDIFVELKPCEYTDLCNLAVSYDASLVLDLEPSSS